MAYYCGFDCLLYPTNAGSEGYGRGCSPWTQDATTGVWRTCRAVVCSGSRHNLVSFMSNILGLRAFRVWRFHDIRRTRKLPRAPFQRSGCASKDVDVLVRLDNYSLHSTLLESNLGVIGSFVGIVHFFIGSVTNDNKPYGGVIHGWPAAISTSFLLNDILH